MPEWRFQSEKIKVAEDYMAMRENNCVALEKQIQRPTESLSCEICDSTFKTKSMLNEHMKEKQTEKYQCDQCDLIFNNKCNSLNTQMKYIHIRKSTMNLKLPLLKKKMTRMLPITISLMTKFFKVMTAITNLHQRMG